MTELGERIKAYRKANGLSQGALASKFGVSAPLVSAWEHGATIGPPYLSRLNELLDDQGSEQPPEGHDQPRRTIRFTKAMVNSMRHSNTAQGRIDNKAIELLKQNPAGLRFSDLVQRIQDALPREAPNEVRAVVTTLPSRQSDEVIKPERGLYQLQSSSAPGVPPPASGTRKREASFYEPFARWLQYEMEECTKAISLGGNRFGGKWGTPDVIGVWKQEPGAFISQPEQIVSAEIKIDTKDLIPAFGQACVYRLFSHKSYIVVPRDAPKDDLDRLDALCMLFGIGLVYFDSNSPDKPSFTIQVRAAKHEPDSFYVNHYIRPVARDLMA